MSEMKLNYSTSHSEKMLEQLFCELFSEYESKLYLFSLKMLKSEVVAKDIIQEVFLKLWTIRNQLPEIKNISAFLYRITENKVIDHLRAAASDQKHRKALWQRLNDIRPCDLREEIGAKEFNYIIQRAIDNLPPQRRSVYLLNKVENLKRDKIAEVMNISPNTVRNQLAKSIQQILVYIKRHNS